MIGRKDTGSKNAQATMELSLMAPLLFVLMCAILEFSWVFYNYCYLDNAVSKAARMGVVGATNDRITEAIIGAVGGLPITNVTIAVATLDGTSVASTDRTAVNLLTVTASIAYPDLTPLSRIVSMANLTPLRSSCTVRVE